MIKNLIFGSLVLLSFSALAEDFNPPKVYPPTAKQTAALVASIKTDNAIKKASCTHVIEVATGGTINTAIGGACALDGSEYELACIDVMTGSTGASVVLNPELTVESQILQLIADQCTGG